MRKIKSDKCVDKKDCNTLQHTATHCNTLQWKVFWQKGLLRSFARRWYSGMSAYACNDSFICVTWHLYWGVLQCVAVCCSMLQWVAVCVTWHLYWGMSEYMCHDSFTCVAVSFTGLFCNRDL